MFIQEIFRHLNNRRTAVRAGEGVVALQEFAALMFDLGDVQGIAGHDRTPAGPAGEGIVVAMTDILPG